MKYLYNTSQNLKWPNLRGLPVRYLGDLDLQTQNKEKFQAIYQTAWRQNHCGIKKTLKQS